MLVIVSKHLFKSSTVVLFTMKYRAWNVLCYCIIFIASSERLSFLMLQRCLFGLPMLTEHVNSPVHFESSAKIHFQRLQKEKCNNIHDFVKKVIIVRESIEQTLCFQFHLKKVRESFNSEKYQAWFHCWFFCVDDYLSHHDCQCTWNCVLESLFLEVVGWVLSTLD